MVAPSRAITFILVFVGIVSSVATDAGYLVLMPLGAAAFFTLGRHPLAGLAAAYAGVAAVFAVNVLIAPLDGILTEITNDAIHLLNPTKSIEITANFYFSVASTIALAFVVTVISEKIVEPRLGTVPRAGDGGTRQEGRPRAAGAARAAVRLLGARRAPGRGGAPDAALGRSAAPRRDRSAHRELAADGQPDRPHHAGVPGDRAPPTASARARCEASADGINAIVKTFAGLSGLLFLFLVMSQFIAYFNYSNMATIIAVNLADWLKSANFPTLVLLVRLRGGDRAPRPHPHRRDPEVGDLRAHLRAALHAAGRRAGAGAAPRIGSATRR